MSDTPQLYRTRRVIVNQRRRAFRCWLWGETALVPAAITSAVRACSLGLQRVVSPQRLVHYRDNWYLDAWCHYKDG